MFREFQVNHPSISFLLVAVGLLGLMLLARWSRRFKYVPAEDHDPSKHHSTAVVLAFVGLLGLASLLAFGWDQVQADASDIEKIEQSN